MVVVGLLGYSGSNLGGEYEYLMPLLLRELEAGD